MGTIIAFGPDHWVLVHEELPEVTETLTPGEWSRFTAVEDGHNILVRESAIVTLKVLPTPSPAELAEARKLAEEAAQAAEAERAAQEPEAD